MTIHQMEKIFQKQMLEKKNRIFLQLVQLIQGWESLRWIFFTTNVITIDILKEKETIFVDSDSWLIRPLNVI